MCFVTLFAESQSGDCPVSTLYQLFHEAQKRVHPSDRNSCAIEHDRCGRGHGHAAPRHQRCQYLDLDALLSLDDRVEVGPNVLRRCGEKKVIFWADALIKRTFHKGVADPRFREACMRHCKASSFSDRFLIFHAKVHICCVPGFGFVRVPSHSTKGLLPFPINFSTDRPPRLG